MNNSRLSRRAALLLTLALAIGSQITLAQQSGDLDVLQVKPNFYLIAGSGGNIGVQIGADGVVVVDAGTAAKAPRVYRSLLLPMPYAASFKLVCRTPQPIPSAWLC